MTNPPRPGTCGDQGPYLTHCTEYLYHDYAHYDAGDDSSWTDDWRDWYEDDNYAALGIEDKT